MSLFSNWNGRIIEEEQVCISPNNRSFRYGDGCFETMKVINGNLLLPDLHFKRLFSSLATLKFTIPSFLTASYFKQQIKNLVQKNGHEELARVRLVLYRGNGTLYDYEDQTPHFIIQCWAGEPHSRYLNEIGFTVDIFKDATKTADLFSSIKSNNFLGYVMAAMAAKENGLNDNILLNASHRIADSTIANVFIVINGVIKTPLLTEGCVGGVMRKYLLGCFKKEHFHYTESEISVDELLNASEVFLTNANYGIRWVKSIGNSHYNNTTSRLLHKKFIAPLFGSATF